MTFEAQTPSGGPSVPIGSIVQFHKDFDSSVSLPEEFEECDGTTINDADSPLDGLTKPDLQGNNRFLRGNSASGSTGGRSDTDMVFDFISTEIFQDEPEQRLGGVAINGNSKFADPFDDLSFNFTNEPQHFDVVMAIRIK
jgi:hypothetical protein